MPGESLPHPLRNHEGPVRAGMRPRILIGVVVTCTAASCTEILGLEITFVDEASSSQGGGGSAAATTTSSGIGGDGAGGDGGGGGSVAGCTVGLAVASDDFLGSDGAGWCQLESAAPSDQIAFVNDGVTLEAVESAWWDQSVGPFVYRNIAQTEGDFVVVTRLDVTNGVGGPLTNDRHGAGLLVRQPNASPGTDENWLKLSVGDLSGSNGMGVKWYSAELSDTSQPPEYQLGTYHAIAICRHGSSFSFFAYDSSSTTWVAVGNDTQHNALNSADVLQVGVAAHAATDASGEVVGKFRYVNFYEVGGSCIDELPLDPLDMK